MPAKKSGKKRRSAKEDIYTKPLQGLQRAYFQEFTKAAVDPIESVRRAIRNCIEAERGPVPLEKLFVEPPPPVKAKPKKENDLPSDKPPPMAGVALSSCLPPLCSAIKLQNFTMIKEIYFWGFPISLHDISIFADILSDMKYPVHILEVVDCNLCSESINRLTKALPSCELLKEVAFDYNEIDIIGLEKLLRSFSMCHKLLEISLCYCGLDSRSGKTLGRYAASSVVRNIYLDGNDLEIRGVTDFFGELMDEFARIDAQLEAIAAAEAAAAATLMENMDGDTGVLRSAVSQLDPSAVPTPGKTVETSALEAGEKPKKKKRKKRSRSRRMKKKLEEVIPPSGPWLRKLHLADTFGGFSEMEHYVKTEFSAPDNRVTSQALDCMKIAKTIALYLAKCVELEELDLYNNWFGYGAGAVLLEALIKRESQEMPRIGMRINRGVDGSLLKKIFKIASGVKKKRKKRKKSAKKK